MDEMFFVCIVLCLCVHSSTPDQYVLRPMRMIALRDHSFSREDKTLTAELKRRMGTDSKIPIQGLQGDCSKFELPDILTMDEQEYLNKSARRQIFNDPKDYTVKFKILDMIRQDIYATQYRLDVMDKIMEKYVTDEEFRVAYMFGKLEEWMYFMRVIYTVVHKTLAYTDSGVSRFRVYRHLLYYAHMLRRNIDVTYTVEEIIRIHNKIYLKLQSKKKAL